MPPWRCHIGQMLGRNFQRVARDSVERPDGNRLLSLALDTEASQKFNAFDVAKDIDRRRRLTGMA